MFGTEFQIGAIEMVANTGTYLDTPFHRFEHGSDLADLPLQRSAGLTGVCIRTAQQAIGADHVAGVEVTDRVILFCTGWDRHWGTDEHGSGIIPT